MLVLVTGLPGAGKTLYALSWVRAKAMSEQRPVFYSGIADLRLPWTEFDAERWHELPSKAIIVIDEAQRVFRPRQYGSAVPKHVSELETHRHKGVDVVLITQHPLLIDTSVRRLAGLHFHVVRKFGAQAATVHEWAAVKEQCDKVRSDSVRHEFVYPSEAFGWYKSAEAHTHKLRIPARVWFLAVLPLVLAGAVYSGWRYFDSARRQAEAQKIDASASRVELGGAARSVAGQSTALTAMQFVEAHQPRVPGLAYTAPVYDDVTAPKEAPFPAMCLSTQAACRCYSQQATRLDVPDELCRRIVADGFFVAWREAAQPPQPAAHGAAQRPVSPASSVRLAF